MLCHSDDLSIINIVAWWVEDRKLSAFSIMKTNTSNNEDNKYDFYNEYRSKKKYNALFIINNDGLMKYRVQTL